MVTTDGSARFSVVELVTQTYVVSGRCRGLTENMRLVDLLNHPEIVHLRLFEAKVCGLAGSREMTASEGHMFLDKMRVVFASIDESPEAGARRQMAHELDRVEKGGHEVLVFAPPFRVAGAIYMVKEADPDIALPRLFGGFLVVTGAKVTYEHDDRLVWERDLLVVNGRYVEMIYSPTAEAARLPADGNGATLDSGNAA
jgi:hypothetical protein